MHRTVAGDRWKALKMSARKLARDARALQKAVRAPSARLEMQRLQWREIGPGRGRGPQAPGQVGGPDHV
jgi:hypothetical protein